MAWLLALSACQTASLPAPAELSPQPTWISAALPSAPAPTYTPHPTALPLPLASPTTDLTDLARDLKVALSAKLTPTATPFPGEAEAFLGIKAVGVLPLSISTPDRPLWIAYSIGSRSYNPLQSHFVALYTRNQEGFQELSRVDLAFADTLQAGAVQEAPMAAGESWLQVTSGSGAHSGCLDLFRVRPEGLEKLISHCSSYPQAGELLDLDHDGQPEALLNLSDAYIFCFACNLSLPNYQAWRWQGDGLAKIQLAEAVQSTSPLAKEANRLAVQLAQADLWLDGWEVIQEAQRLDKDNEAIRWNRLLIQLILTRRQEATASSSYPLLAHLFYGDYPAIMQIFSAVKPSEVFSPHTPLVKGTIAEGYPLALQEQLLAFSERALQAQPENAAAHFVRGWALYLAAPGTNSWISEIETAARLAPHDDFLQRCLAYIK